MSLAQVQGTFVFSATVNQINMGSAFLGGGVKKKSFASRLKTLFCVQLSERGENLKKTVPGHSDLHERPVF